MKRRRPGRARAVLVRTRGDIGLAANDGLDTGALGFLVKFDRAMQVPVVRDRHGGHSEFDRLLHQLLHSDSSIQQRVLGVKMEMNE